MKLFDFVRSFMHRSKRDKFLVAFLEQHHVRALHKNLLLRRRAEGDMWMDEVEKILLRDAFEESPLVTLTDQKTAYIREGRPSARDYEWLDHCRATKGVEEAHIVEIFDRRQTKGGIAAIIRFRFPWGELRSILVKQRICNGIDCGGNATKRFPAKYDENDKDVPPGDDTPETVWLCEECQDCLSEGVNLQCRTDYGNVKIVGL